MKTALQGGQEEQEDATKRRKHVAEFARLAIWRPEPTVSASTSLCQVFEGSFLGRLPPTGRLIQHLSNAFKALRKQSVRALRATHFASKEGRMKRVQVDVTGQTAASPSAVYEVAKDSSGYPRWSRIGSFEHVRSGRDEPYGVGSVRIFRTWPLKIVEEVVELVPQRRVSYIVHRGLPFRDYRADIELAPSRRRHRHSLAEFVLSDGSRHRLPVSGFHAAGLTEMLPALAAEAERIEQSSSRSTPASC